MSDTRKTKLVEPYIVEKICNGTGRLDHNVYFVRIFRYVKTLGIKKWFYKTFDTLEEAKEYRDNILNQNKEETWFQDENYPLNLISEIFKNDFTDLDMVDIIHNFDSRLELIKFYDLGLNERELKILELRYKKGYTLDNVGKEFGVQKERIRQIEKKSLLKLRHPYRKGIIKGMYELGRYKNRIKELEYEYQKQIIYLQQKIKNLKLGIKTSEYDEMVKNNKTIENLDLSVRTYNCLKRAGLNKYEDFVNITIEELIKVRNIGRNSLKRLTEKLKEVWLIDVYENDRK